MNLKLRELKKRLTEISDLKAALAVLSWDQMTLMPPGGAEARGRQIAVLNRLSHEKLIDSELGKLLDELRPLLTELPPESEEAALIRVAARDYEQAVKVPPSFTSEFSEHTSKIYTAWVKARTERDFKPVEPLLEKTLELSRRLANFFPGYQHIADPLIDQLDEGMTVAIIRPLFGKLREELIPLVKAITSRPAPDDFCLRGQFSEAKQLEFGLEVAKSLGFDFTRGRQDQSPHPFTTSFGIGDVRITTRVRTDFLGEALFSTIHEAGHALYEQGINPDFDGTPLADGASMSLHESQSRLWENLVGRSRNFWEHFFPKLQRFFPDQLGAVSLDAFYRAINKVEPSLIRTDADEVTYNLHVMLRFDLEIEMLEGKLAVKDLSEAWNERYRQDLGLLPPDDGLGVLQDVHWYSGTIGGYFQSYTLGNILSAQIFEAALRANSGIPVEIKAGNFQSLHQWLKRNIYRFGRQYPAVEIIKSATGRELEIEPYVRYLKTKYRELYSL
ncbi:MAG: carboxypeptidase M32 [Firmicutes bacterium]|nr:carboxypeptidase M32 [Bacillota bacterium]